MEGENKEEDKNEAEAPPEAEPPPEEPPPPPEEPPPPPEEPPPPPEEPPPPPEEPPPPPEEPPPPSPEKLASSIPTSKAPSLDPVAEVLTEAPLESSPSNNAAVKPSSILRISGQKSNQISQRSFANDLTSPLGVIKSPSKSGNDLENNQITGKKTQSRLTPDGGGGVIGFPGFGNFTCGFLNKRSPYIHNPPQPEERRSRILNPRTPREYIINLREDLADFQESHGLPRTRDYSFLSLGLALAQETARTLCSLFLMFAELFPIVAIISLIMRFALDKLIEILETDETVPKVKKSIVFALQMLVIIIPLWILIGTVILPLLSLVFSILKRMLRLKGRGKRRCGAKTKPCPSFDLLGIFS